MTVLQRIKRIVFSGRVEFTEKASLELERDDLIEQDVIESVVYARSIRKTLKSTSPFRTAQERLHVIVGPNLQGIPIYSKGKIVEQPDGRRYYVFVSAKLAD